MIEVWQIPPSLINDVYEVIHPLLERAISRGSMGLSIPDIMREAELGRVTIMVMSDGDDVLAASVNRIERWPEGNVYRIIGLGGTGIRKWLKAFDAACEEHAREFNCVMIDFGSRSNAWTKLFGMEPAYYGYQREINYGDR